MSFWDWLKAKFSGGTIPTSSTDMKEAADEYTALYGDVYIREMAFWSAVNLIANAVSKCEFKTFLKGKEVKGPEYYLWNIEPNRNQNSSGFIRKWITRLYRKNECLIIEQNGKLLIADSFTRKPYALYDDIFTEVTVGDFTFSRSFLQSEVLYWQLNSVDINGVLAGLFDSYSRLINYSMKAYQKSRGTKGIFKYETLPAAGTEQREKFDELVNGRIKTWLNGDNAALPLGAGQNWTELQHKTYSTESTRDIRAQIDDVSDFHSKAFGIPPVLLRGDVQGTKDAVDSLLTFCIDPLVDTLQEEIIRKRYGYAGYAAGSYLQIDTKAIKHVDLLSVSTAIDKLIASGGYCINDIRKLTGDTIIDEPWAWKHWMTKNYAPAEEVMTALEGGENK